MDRARIFGPAAVIAAVVLAFAPLAAQTVVVTPSNPQGWTGSEYYGPTGTTTGTGAFAGITSTYPRSGNGSAEIKLNDEGNSEADWAMNFVSGQSLSSVTALQYDWFRSSASTTNGLAMPAFALSMSDGSYLIYERGYNLSPSDPAAAPVDQWTTANILNGNFWRATHSGTGDCGYSQVYRTLSFFNSTCYGGNATVTGLDLFLGYGYPGTFDGAVDNATIGFGRNEATTYNFEPDQSTVPEPSSMALLGTGLIGLVPMVRRRLKK
jgi:hypothetical protein